MFSYGHANLAAEDGVCRWRRRRHSRHQCQDAVARSNEAAAAMMLVWPVVDKGRG